MTLKEFKKKYSGKDFNSFPGDSEIRYKAFAPMFENLYEGKMIYQERGVGMLVRVENLAITSTGFRIDADVICIIYDRHNSCPEIKRIDFSASWSWMLIDYRYNNVFFAVPYVSFCIWMEEHIIKYVEKLITENKTDEIHKVMWGYALKKR
jgi:hypothetical protein